MTIHSTITAWKIPWMEELGRLQCMESQRVGHDLMTKHICVCVCVCVYICQLPRWLSSKKPAYQCRRCGFDI